ncbi:Polynucleotide kinase 3 phosphatase [Penicillium maclennaniae]|uniref:Polynucleotide kinase 3 phosphatase n=1 Tax=Penicillium maclennaniae TaxID=1343394 RepID=UPI002540AFB6|nr:Polynucleotide kinase 3 phosphatase [Penicillium maclennaniae]KAJ5670298.1 Polynucleotide kinase 3 phosphatase [Penicillium maclennaniae]
MSAGNMKRTASPTRPISPPPLRRKVESSITKTAAANFFTPASQKKPEPIKWRILGTSLIIGKFTPENNAPNLPDKDRKIAAFDLDSTLIKTKSGNTFPRSATDWQWWNNVVPGKLRELNSAGFQVVVFSNQKKIAIQKDIKAGSGESKSLTTFKEKITAMMNDLQVPISVYAATTDAEYRKPRLGMWREFQDDYDLDVTGIDMKGSFFVGDAGGRPGDHSAADLGFACNAGLKYHTPEEFFLRAGPRSDKRHFQSQILRGNGSRGTPYVAHIEQQCTSVRKLTCNLGAKFTRKHSLELVIFCGSPGAGKSSYYWNNMEPLGYERVNQDILKTRPKCLKVAREHLEAKKSVVVDNTNASIETRGYWIALAKELNVPIRCIQFISTPDLCKHNNAVRASNKEMNPESRTFLPGIAFGDFGRRFQEPTLGEGFEDIIPVKFQFQGTEEAKKIWEQFWI